MREETARLERAMEEERRNRKGDKENRRRKEARESYERRWKDLSIERADARHLKFEDIPWPIYAAHVKQRTPTALALEALTADAIATFIFRDASLAKGPTSDATEKKERKERLRETMLRFHPDKFEGRLMKRVRESDQTRVREAVGQVVRALNTLMGGEGT